MHKLASCLHALKHISRPLLLPPLMTQSHASIVGSISSSCSFHMSAGVSAKSFGRRRTLDDVVNEHRSSLLSAGFTVTDILPGGKVQDIGLVSVAELGIPARDAGLFISGSTHATNQRAAIMVRNNKILFKTEAARAVISRTRASIIMSTSKSHKAHETTLKIITKTIDGEADDLVPFELNVLEALLFLTSSYFDVRIGHLNFMYEGVLNDMKDVSTEPFSTVASEALVQQLAPLDKAITTSHNDARETREAISELLNDENTLGAICLSSQESKAGQHSLPHLNSQQHQDVHAMHNLPQHERHHAVQQQTHHRQHNEDSAESEVEQVRRMLATYEREMSSVMGQLDELRENLDGSREACAIKLDSARNEIILVNLKMTLASLCLMVCVIMPTMLGMNVQHNLPDQAWMFWSISGASVVLSILFYPLTTHLFRRAYRLRENSEVVRFTSLRLFLMQHLDDLDDIRSSLDGIKGSVNREQFKEHLQATLPGTKFSSGSLDCLFDQYDCNKDGVVQEEEIRNRNAKDITSISQGRSL